MLPFWSVIEKSGPDDAALLVSKRTTVVMPPRIAARIVIVIMSLTMFRLGLAVINLGDSRPEFYLTLAELKCPLYLARE
jgi:hypothetical protein